MRRNDKEVKNKRIFRLYRRYVEIERELENTFPVHFYAFPKWYTFQKHIDDMDYFLKLRDEAISIKYIIHKKEYKRFVKYVNGGNTYSFTPLKKKERKKSLRKLSRLSIGHFLMIYEEDKDLLVMGKTAEQSV